MENVQYFSFVLITALVFTFASENEALAFKNRQLYNTQLEIEDALRSFLRYLIKPKYRYRYLHEHHRPEARPKFEENRRFDGHMITTPIPVITTKDSEAVIRGKPMSVLRFPKNIDRSGSIEKPGVCSATASGPWVCSSHCVLDSDCKGSKKCCTNRCGATVCQKPINNYKEQDVSNY